MRLENGYKLEGNSFVSTLAISDIRRHAVGLKSSLSNGGNLAEVDLRNRVIVVFYINLTSPRITIISIDHLLKIQPGNEKDQNLFRKMHASAGGLGTGRMYMLLQYCWGGEEPIMEPHEIPTSIFVNADLGDGKPLIPGYSIIPPWSRAPALSFEGANPLVYKLDHIDECLLDVYKNYRVQTPRKDKEHISVFDYVERKIAARELLPEPVFFSQET